MAFDAKGCCWVAVEAHSFAGGGSGGGNTELGVEAILTDFEGEAKFKKNETKLFKSLK